MRQTNIDFKNNSFKEFKRISDNRTGIQYTRAFQKAFKELVVKMDRKEKIRRLFNI